MCLNEDYVLGSQGTKPPSSQNYPVHLIFFPSCSYVDYLIEMLRSRTTLSGNFKADFSIDLGAGSSCEMRLIQLSRLKTLGRKDFPNCNVMSRVLSLLKNKHF